MLKHEEYEKRTEELIGGFISENGYTLVDIEYVKEVGEWYLRLYIDKEGGVNIGDCEKVSRFLSNLLDKEDFIDEAYTLEVSSPGLLRLLKKEKDFERNLGKEIEVQTFTKVENEKNFIGILKSFDKDNILLFSNERTVQIERKNISLIREYVNFDELYK